MASSSSSSSSRKQSFGSLLARAQQDVAKSATSFEVSKSAGMEPGTVMLEGYVTKVWKSTSVPRGYDRISVTPIMPFRINNTGAAESSEDGREIVFRYNKHEYRMQIDATYSISIMNSGLNSETSGWFIVKGLGYSRTVKNGVAYDNLTASSIEPWKNGPNVAQMYSVLSQIFDPLHLNIRPIPKGFLPVVTADVVEDDTANLTDDQKKELRKKAKESKALYYSRALQDKISELLAEEESPFTRYLLGHFDQWRKDGDPLKTTDKRSRTAPLQVFLTLSEAAHEMAQKLDIEGGHKVIVDAFPYTWSDTIVVRDKDGKATEVSDSTEPIKTQLLAKGVASVVRADYEHETIDTIRLEFAAWKDIITQAFGISHPPTAEELIPHFLPHTRSVLAGRFSPTYTGKMEVNAQQTSTAEGAPISGLSLDVREVYLDYAHLFNNLCFRVDGDTAKELFTHFLKSQNAPILAPDTCNPEWILRTPGMSNDARTMWSFYLNKNTAFDRMGFETVLNLTGRGLTFYFSEKDQYHFYVMANTCGVFPEFQELLNEHADFHTNKHLKTISKEVESIIKTGRSDMIKPQPTGRPLTFQIFAVNAEFMEMISNPFEIQWRKSAAAIVPTEATVRSGSDLLADDDGNIPNVADLKPKVETEQEKKPIEKNEPKPKRTARK